MAEKYWYYVKDDRQEGPIPESELQGMFNAGNLEPETLVWSESLTNWTPAVEIESFSGSSKSSTSPPWPSKPTPFPSQEQEVPIENTSGQGKSAVIPGEIRRWNWGAFSLNWIWGLGNRTYIALLFFVPFVGLAMPFVLGAEGNKWAWQNKRWNSIEHFKRVQKIWSWVGLAVFLFSTVGIVGIIAAIAIPNFLADQKKAITTEAKQELGHIRTIEMTFYAENNKYGNLASIGWIAPTSYTSYTRYTYSLSYSSTTFLARATGNIDGDATIDEWTIDHNNLLTHQVDDIKN